MPSETIHLRKEHWQYLDDLIEDSSSLENRSQALKYVINARRQRMERFNDE